MRIPPLGKFLRTVRYLKAHQIISRIDYRTRCLFFQTPLYEWLDDPADAPKRILVQPPHLWEGRKEEGKEIARRNFTFIGRTVNMGHEIKWHPRGVSHLWLYNLHYFDWLSHLRTQGPNGRKEAQKLIQSWLNECSKFHPKVWHPYPTSRRIVSWLTHYTWLFEESNPTLEKQFLHSLGRQATHLASTLEWDIGGNHLFQNLKALIFAGICLPNRQSILLDAISLMLEQINVQIMGDGAHYELSPHYHLDMLKDMLDIHALLLKAGQTPPPQLDDAIDRMASALNFYTYPDGHLGLFNDSALNYVADIKAVLKRCGVKEKPSVQLANAGYVRLHKGQTMAMIDVGKVCPDELPGHAHADTLSFEMVHGKERVFVNCGTYAYQDKLRNMLRGTPAHNTVSIDGEDSAEVWANFRVGRRPRKVPFSVIEEKGTGIGVEASHDGYRHLGVSHQRKMFISEDGEDLRGEDFVKLKSSRKAPPKAKAHFHLHPDVTVRMKSESEAEITTKSGITLSFKVRGGRLQEAPSRYAPQFGEIYDSKQLIIIGKWKKGECLMQWAIKRV